jgi:hypothetical protein
MQNTITLRQDQLGAWWVRLGDHPTFDPTRLKLFHPRRGWKYDGRWCSEIHGPFPTKKMTFEDTLTESMTGGT